MTAGIFGLLGVALGIAGSYWTGKRLLDAQSKRNIDLLALQTEREAAERAEEALHRIEIESHTAKDWGRLHNQWSDEVLGPTTRVGDAEIRRRVNSVAVAIFHAWQNPDAGLAYGVLRAIDNAREALRAFLANRPLPPSTFPSNEKLHDLLWGEGRGRPDYAVYQASLADHG